jgi:hypothetical protein
VWYTAGHHDPLFADKGTKLLKADCRFSETVDGVRSAQPAASGEAAAKKASLAEAATFLPMRNSKKATVTEQLVAGLQNALGGPSVNG